jgi:hypothetical protein
MKGKTGWVIALVVAILLGVGAFYIDSHFDNKAATEVEDTTQKGPSD